MLFAAARMQCKVEMAIAGRLSSCRGPRSRENEIVGRWVSSRVEGGVLVRGECSKRAGSRGEMAGSVQRRPGLVRIAERAKRTRGDQAPRWVVLSEPGVRAEEGAWCRRLQ